MPNHPLFVVMLENSKAEQLSVTVYLSHHLITGFVTNVDDAYAELRTSDGKRCVIAIDKIEAIITA